jgi:hypothetical protein
MKTRKRTILVLSALGYVTLLSVAVTAAINPSATADDAFALGALEGVRGVRVKVVKVFSVFEATRFRPEPIDAADIQAGVELALRNAGIGVFEENLPDPGVAELVIMVNTWPTQLISRCILEVSTQLYQLADLVGGHKLRVMAPTWPPRTDVARTKMAANVKRNLAARTVAKEVNRHVEIFIADYLVANPDRQTVREMTGTIIRLDQAIPSCIRATYEIIGDNGKHYKPLNLPAAFEIHGLRVWLRFRPIPRGSHNNVIKIIEIDALGAPRLQHEKDN